MSKALKLSLLVFVAVAILGGSAYFLFKKKPTDKKSASSAASDTLGSATVVDTSTAASVLPTPLETGSTPVSVRRVFPLSGNVAGLIQKSGKGATEIQQFLSWDANRNKRGAIQDWVADWWVNNFSGFVETYNQYLALTDTEYNNSFNY